MKKLNMIDFVQTVENYLVNDTINLVLLAGRLTQGERVEVRLMYLAGMGPWETAAQILAIRKEDIKINPASK